MNQRVIADPSQHGWTEVDGKWVWDAESGGAGAGMVISETEPTDKAEGMQWLNPTTGLVLFWDDEKWLQMPTTGAAGKDGKDAVWSEDANGANYTGTVTVKGELLAAKADAGADALAVGVNAGMTTQDQRSVAVGSYSGETSQSSFATAVGDSAGRENQGQFSVAVGHLAGRTVQGIEATAVGFNAGNSGQGLQATAVGRYSGNENQGEFATAVGDRAGALNQGESAVAVGREAGRSGQALNATSVGFGAGNATQGESAVALGRAAGMTNQGDYSIAIGREAGKIDQAANGIIISSTGDAINNTGANHIQIQSAPTKYLLYNGTNAWTFSGGTVNGLNGFRQNGAPVIDAKGLISTLSTLRNATKDETTLEGMRDALAGSISGLIEGLEHEIATQEISE
jgi:hypothetical protein